MRGEANQTDETASLLHPPGDHAHHVLLSHGLLLGERLHLMARLRFGAAVGIVLGSLFATYVVHVRGLHLCELMATALAVASYNLAIFFAVRPFRRPDRAATGYRRLVRIAHLSIALDYLALTYTIWLVGGSQSPFLAFYLLHAVFAAVMLTRRSAFVHATVGYLLLAGLMVGEWFGLIPRMRPLGAVPAGAETDLRLLVTRLFAYGLLIEGATFLTTGITRLLRGGELRLREAADRLERLAALRRSFVHVVLHDLRSPVGAAITLIDNVINLGQPLGEEQQRWLGRAEARLRGALDLLRGLRLLADLETEPLQGMMQPLDLLPALRATIDEFADLAQQRRQTLRAELPEQLPPVRGIERLLRQAIANYVSNAVKYTGEGGEIVVRALPADGFVRVEVSDNGPGILPADQEHLFHEFARGARPGQPRAPGTGLGLSIVRRVAEQHGGRVGVSSHPGQGSTFFIELPLNPQSALATTPGP
jgi:signal transduction histidine kinase